MSRRAWIWTVAALALVAFIVWAWIDGGERPLEPIVQPVPLPEGFE